MHITILQLRGFSNEFERAVKKDGAMIFRFFLLMVGFGLAVISGVTLIAYLNLITTGHGVHTYLKFILRQPDPYIFLMGLILITCSLCLPSKR